MLRKFLFFLLVIVLYLPCNAQEENHGYRTKTIELIPRFKILGYPFLNTRYSVMVLSGGAELRIRERVSIMGEYVRYWCEYLEKHTTYDGLDYAYSQLRVQSYVATEFRFYPRMLNLPDENGERIPRIYYGLNHKFGKRTIRTDSQYKLSLNAINYMDATFNEFNLLMGFQTKDRLGIDISSGLGWRIEDRHTFIYKGQNVPAVESNYIRQRPSFVVRWSIFYNLTKD